MKKVPVKEVISLSKQGYGDADIIQYLREQGYSATAINDAMNQAKIKLELERTAGGEYESEEEMEPSIMSRETEEAPTPTGEAEEAAYPSQYYAGKSASAEAIEEIAEEIINEKWQEFKAKAGDISELRSYIESRLRSIEERIKRLEIAFDKIQTAMIGKVQEYGKDIKSLGSEMQALEGAFSKILQPLAGSVKELREVTEEMKKPKPEKKVKKKI